jgi:hypothetical protein
MCTLLLSPGVNPIGVNKYINVESTCAIVVVEFLTEILPLRINFTKHTKLIKIQDFISYFILNHWKLKYTNLKLAVFLQDKS